MNKKELNKLQKNMIFCCLILIKYEEIKKEFKEKTSLFFSKQNKKSPCGFKDNSSYKKNILSHENTSNINTKDKEFYGAIEFYYERGILSENDKEFLKKITDIRNIIAHELFEVISERLDKKKYGFEKIDFEYMNHNLNKIYYKISKGWVVNFEAEINDELDEMDDIDKNKIEPFQDLNFVALDIFSLNEKDEKDDISIEKMMNLFYGFKD